MKWNEKEKGTNKLWKMKCKENKKEKEKKKNKKI